MNTRDRPTAVMTQCATQQALTATPRLTVAAARYQFDGHGASSTEELNGREAHAVTL